MINTFIALLIEKGIVSEEEGKAFAEKMKNSMLPADFNSAHAQVKKFLAAIAKDL